jgi:hypothetical protein
MFAYMIALVTEVPVGFAEASLYYEKTINPDREGEGRNLEAF